MCINFRLFLEYSLFVSQLHIVQHYKNDIKLNNNGYYSIASNNYILYLITLITKL